MKNIISEGKRQWQACQCQPWYLNNIARNGYLSMAAAAWRMGRRESEMTIGCLPIPVMTGQ